MDKEDRVFVISQIGEQGTPIRKRADVIADLIVTPVAKEFGLETLRSDRDPTPGPITPQILRSILSSRVVVADLTGRNPNVYYELCFAQSFGVPVIMLVDKTAGLPFDVKDERTIPIGDAEGTIDMPAGEVAKAQLKNALEVVLKDDYEPLSMVNEVASVQNIESMSPTDPVASELATLTRRVDQIHERIFSPPPRSSSSYRATDLQQLMTFVETLARRNSVTPTDLDALVTDTTSGSFDAWIYETIASIPGQENDSPDFEDVPF